MKAKLIKNKDYYRLFVEGKQIAGTGVRVSSNKMFQLSFENCDELFGVIDVEKLADEETNKYATLTPKSFKRGFMYGLNKAMELNQDKVFTLEDMEQLVKSAFYAGLTKGQGKNKDFDIDKYTEKHLQQSTEIEVEIEEFEYIDGKNTAIDYMLDSEGCLILKRK